jgi:cell division septal protein FtsQ
VSSLRKVLIGIAVVSSVALVLLAWNWFRDSSLVKVRHVEIAGVSNSPDAAAIKRELNDAALRMTTLHVDRGELEHAVSAYSIVRSVSASPHFPSTLHVQVHEYAPVAALTGPDGAAVPVAFDGTLLPRVAKQKLPAVAVSSTPQHDGFESLRVRTLVRVLAAAPAPLRPQLERAHLDPDRGIVVAMRNGPTLAFGTSARLAAKWASATRVLATASSSGAAEIDVRVPGRPAASGFATAQNPRL